MSTKILRSCPLIFFAPSDPGVTPTAVILFRWLLILPESDRGQSSTAVRTLTRSALLRRCQAPSSVHLSP